MTHRCLRLGAARTVATAVAALVVAVSSARAAPATVALAPEDHVLSGLVEQALNARPELAQARAEARAARERVPQASALPDPMLQVGVQNDGFSRWQVGSMESSWVLFMASQTLPFPGKVGLRGELAQVELDRRELGAERVRLATVADVRRGYLALQLARARLGLLERLSGLLEKSVAVAQVRYETGTGPQSDVLRARLELARLRQQRVLLSGEEQLELASLNRLRHRPLDAPVGEARAFEQLAFPAPPEEAVALADSSQRSPELAAARAGARGAEKGRALSRKSYLPDLAVGAGVMLRGSLEPMWTVTLGVPIPVFAGSKQAREVAEARELADAAARELEGVEQVVALRTYQRLAAWRALEAVWRGYQQGLLVNAAATAESTLTQYRVGSVPFAAVLEANASTIDVEDSSLRILADAWRLAIAQDEVSLADVGLGGAAMGTSVPGAAGGMSSPSPTGAASMGAPVPVRGTSSSGM